MVIVVAVTPGALAVKFPAEATEPAGCVGLDPCDALFLLELEHPDPITAAPIAINTGSFFM